MTRRTAKNHSFFTFFLPRAQGELPRFFFLGFWCFFNRFLKGEVSRFCFLGFWCYESWVSDRGKKIHGHSPKVFTGSGPIMIVF